jgi:hypothetical protein
MSEEIGLIARFEVQGEDKVIRANRDVARSTEQVTNAVKAEGAAMDTTARQVADLAAEKAVLARRSADLTRREIALARVQRRQAQAAEDAQRSSAQANAAMAGLNIVLNEAVQILKSVGRELVQTAVELFENTDEGIRLAEAWDELKDSIILAAVPFEDTKQILLETAIAIERLSSGILSLSSDLAGYAAVAQSVKDENALANAYTTSAEAAIRNIPILGLFADSIVGSMQRSAAATGLFGDKLAQSTEKAFQFAKAQRDAQNPLKESEEDARDYSRAIESLARLLARAANAQAEFNARQSEITRGAEFDRVQAATDRFVGLAEIESDLQDEIAEINRDANRAVERAQTRHQRSLTRIAQRGADERAKLIQQERLRREFDERRFDLTTLQNERLYLAERNRLVAQGDVLAIDELDERFALQQEIEEENFRLQQQRQEATFQLQLQFQERAARQQAQILAETLAEQLRTIEENRQERLSEAATAAEEERMEVKGNFALEIAAIDAQEQLKLEQLEKGWAERQSKEAENLAEFIRKNDLAAGDVLAAWHAVYGPNGTFDALVLAAMRRAAQYTAIAAAAIAGVSAIRSGGTGFRPGVPIRYRAHGGDEIVSSPTMFMAGEGGPERVVTQPLSSIGGALTVRWSGGPIPLQGSGGLENMNLDPVGQALAQGLTASITEAFLRQRGNFGR